MILLVTANARYSHAALGIRYLRANLGAWRAQSQILEFTLEDRPEDIAERLLAHSPRLVALSVYIWNVTLMNEVASILRTLEPQLWIVAGGPEVSYESESSLMARYCSAIVQGAGEASFFQLVEAWLGDQKNPRFPKPDEIALPLIIPPHPRALHNLSAINLPHDEYDEDDLRHRHIYFEAGRGCPFKCSFCLSSLDLSAFSFPLDKVLQSLETLCNRGLRNYKFVDRTFNLSAKASVPILDWFLDKLPEEPFFVHFEMIPDHLPPAIANRLQRFPKGAVQLEVGVQTFNEAVQKNIARQQDNAQTETNLRFLMTQTQVHLHTDLIFGLPGETIASMAKGFCRLWRCGVQEIQVGILKRLRGAPINQLTDAYAMRYDTSAPYSILANNTVSFAQMQKLKRFARFWDLIGNSGRFHHSLPLLLQAPTDFSKHMEEGLIADEDSGEFWNFWVLVDSLYRLLGKTHQIAFERLIAAIFSVATTVMKCPPETMKSALIEDYQRSVAKGKLIFEETAPSFPSTQSKPKRTQRQARHY